MHCSFCCQKGFRESVYFCPLRLGDWVFPSSCSWSERDRCCLRDCTHFANAGASPNRYKLKQGGHKQDRVVRNSIVLVSLVNFERKLSNLCPTQIASRDVHALLTLNPKPPFEDRFCERRRPRLVPEPVAGSFLIMRFRVYIGF